MSIELREHIIYFEFSSFLVAFLCLLKHKETFFKVFVAYLLVIYVIELLINTYFENNNKHIYDILTFFEFNLIFLLFYTLNKEGRSRILIKYFAIGFNLIYAISFYYQILKDYTVILGPILGSVLMFIYLKDLLKSDKVVDYKRNLSLFITVTLLFYYLSTIPFFTMLYITGMRDSFLFYIVHIITIVTHLSFIFGMLWSKAAKN